MTTKRQIAAQATDPVAARFDPVRRYSVQLSQAAEYPVGSGRYLSPGADHLELRGDVANSVQASILDATLIDDVLQGR